MFGLGTLQTYGIVAAVIATVAFGAGYKTKDAFCDAASAKLQVVQLTQRNIALEGNIRQMKVVAEQDAKQQQVDADKAEQAEKTAHETVTKTPTTSCLSADDAERLRQWFLKH